MFAKTHREVVVESVEPHRAIVRGEAPLPDDDGSELALHERDLLLLGARVVVEGQAGGGVHPRLVDAETMFLCSVEGTIVSAGYDSNECVSSFFRVVRYMFAKLTECPMRGRGSCSFGTASIGRGDGHSANAGSGKGQCEKERKIMLYRKHPSTSTHPFMNPPHTSGVNLNESCIMNFQYGALSFMIR